MNDADLIKNIRCATCHREVPENHILTCQSEGRADTLVCSYPCATGDTSWTTGKTMRRPWMDIAIPLVVLVCLLLMTSSMWQLHKHRMTSDERHRDAAQAIDALTKQVEGMRRGTNP